MSAGMNRMATKTGLRGAVVPSDGPFDIDGDE